MIKKMKAKKAPAPEQKEPSPERRARNDYQAARREELREQGLCYDCAGPKLANEMHFGRCRPCRVRANESSKRSQAGTQKRTRNPAPDINDINLKELYEIPAGPPQPRTVSAWTTDKRPRKNRTQHA